MKVVSITLELIAAGAGLWAAWLWLQSSNVQIDLGIMHYSGDAKVIQEGLTSATIAAFAEAAKLNQRAARWTAVSVAATAVASVLSALAGSN